MEVKEITEKVQELQPVFERAKAEVAKIIVGQKELIDSILIALLAGGHLLVEGVPGLAKTLAVSTFSKVLGADFGRIQFTPDLLPADLTGTAIYNTIDGKFTVKKGPIFTNLLLADEINRAPPKVQSALLEVMQEKQVTIAGETYKLTDPFIVIATQNPIEQEGTYVLPEAQTDRFMLKTLLTYPTFEEEKVIMSRMGKVKDLPTCQRVLSVANVLEARGLVDQIYLDETLVDYILQIVFATREPLRYVPPIDGLLQFGASPRASLGLKLAAKAQAFLEGRGYVVPEDIKKMVHPILRHRLRRTYEAEAENISTDAIVDRILAEIDVP